MGDADLTPPDGRDEILGQLAETNHLLRELVDATTDAKATVEQTVAKERRSRRIITAMFAVMLLVVTTVGGFIVVDLRDRQTEACIQRDRIIRVVEALTDYLETPPAERAEIAKITAEAAGTC